MRILLVAHAFPPRSTAGVEVYTLRLARALQRQGQDVAVLAAAHDLAAEPYSVREREHEGIGVAEVVNTHAVGTLRATYDDPALRRAVGRVVRQQTPDVVHAQHLLNVGAGVLPEARSAGAAVVLTLHDYWLSCPRDGLRMREDLALCSQVDHAACGRCLRTSPYLVPAAQRGVAAAARAAGWGRALHSIQRHAPRLVEWGLRAARHTGGGRPAELSLEMERRARVLRRWSSAADLVLAPTRFALERGRELGIEAERMEVVPLGVLESPPQPRAAGPRRRFGYVGTIAPHKGVLVLVEAFRDLAEPDLRLVIHGSLDVFPGYAARLRAEAASDPRISFAGPFPEGSQGAVLADLDVLVVPSLWWENSPLTAIEALGAGRGVIASRTGGVGELIEDGVSGLLVPPGDVAALSAAMASVSCGEALSGAAEPLSLKTVDAHASELAEIYEQTLTQRRSSALVEGASPRASVVVPVRDGAKWLPALLDCLEAQRLDGGLDILAIDSGSSDGSPELLERRDSVRLLRVSADAFDHGETRNLGVREARGDVVLFLSQDAVPTSPDYARRLVETLSGDERVVGAWARQVPRHDADPLTRRDIESWTAGGSEPRCSFHPEPEALARLEPLERYALAALDNVASAVRRDVLLAHPFAPSRFGEDVEWAQRMLGLGHGLAYVPAASVEHSHARSASGLYRRNYRGHRTLFRLFGLRTVPDRAHLVRGFLGALASDLTELRRNGAAARLLASAPGQAWAATYGQYRGAHDEAKGRCWPEWA